MKNLIYFFIVFMAITNAFANSMCNNPAHNHNLKVNINQAETMVVTQDENTKNLVVKGGEETETVDMKNVKTISLKGKNADDKVSFFINGEKRTYKVSDIKTIKVKTIERAE